MKKICGNVKKIMVILLAVVFCLPWQVTAATAIDTTAYANLKLSFIVDEDIPATDTEIRLYQVAEVSAYCEFTLTEAFAKYPLSFEGMEESQWQDVVMNLQGYIAADKIEADYSMKVDAEGWVEFPELPVGLYLVASDIFHANDKYYMPQTFMVCLPNLNEKDEWQYDVVTDVKYESEPDGLMDLEILKVWKDNDYSGRPESIEVEVYKGNELYDTITLNQENNWCVKLKDVDAGAIWSVKEKNVPEEYEVSIEKQAHRIVINNVRNVPTPTPPPSLPQTGVLWWPVPALLAGGLFLVLLGYLRRRGNEDEN